jgi:hypothetical protein
MRSTSDTHANGSKFSKLGGFERSVFMTEHVPSLGSPRGRSAGAGGASFRRPVTREIESYWHPVSSV